MKKEKMVKEAIVRMGMLELLDSPEESVVREFEENKQVFVSRFTQMLVNGTREKWAELFTLSDEEKALVEMIEKEQKILVYHVIKNVTKSAILYAMLYVSGYEEDWPIEREELEAGEKSPLPVSAYVWSAGRTEEHDGLLDGYGEYGSILIVKSEGGLYREG